MLLSAIIGCWYAYQQNKNAKRHLRRMAKDMEGLQKAETALTEMQKVKVLLPNFGCSSKLKLNLHINSIESDALTGIGKGPLGARERCN